MEEAVERRLAFTRHVEEVIRRAPKARSAEAAGWFALLDPAKAVGAVVKAAIDSAVTVWKVWRDTRDLKRRAIADQIEALAWKIFADVPPAIGPTS